MTTERPTPKERVHDGEWCRPCLDHGADLALAGVAEAQEVRVSMTTQDSTRTEAAMLTAWRKTKDFLRDRLLTSGRSDVNINAVLRVMNEALTEDPPPTTQDSDTRTRAVGKCGCNCRCHADEASPDWPGPCAGCCEPGINCDCGRALAAPPSRRRLRS